VECSAGLPELTFASLASVPRRCTLSALSIVAHLSCCQQRICTCNAVRTFAAHEAAAEPSGQGREEAARTGKDARGWESSRTQRALLQWSPPRHRPNG
jgi:hypothetical protein